MSLQQQFRDTLRTARGDDSQRTVAEKLGIKRVSYQQIESGRYRSTSLVHAEKMLNTLGYNVALTITRKPRNKK